MTAPGALRVVSMLAAAVVLSAGCDGGGSTRGTEGSEAGTQDATSSSSGGGSGGGSGSSSGSGASSSGGGLAGSSGGSGRDAGPDDGGSDGGVDSGPLMQSCAPGGPGLSNCGSAIESCCTTLEVPGGTYDRTYDPLDTYGNVTLTSDGGPTGEADPASVSGFRLDKYEVTVGRFRQFVDAVLSSDGGAAWTPPAGSGKHTHLNGGNGLSSIGGGYEPGWVTSDNESLVPTNANLACPGDGTWTSTPGSQESPPDQLRELVRGVCLLHLGRGLPPECSRMGVRRRGGKPAARIPMGLDGPGDEQTSTRSTTATTRTARRRMPPPVRPGPASTV